MASRMASGTPIYPDLLSECTEIDTHCGKILSPDDYGVVYKRAFRGVLWWFIKGKTLSNFEKMFETASSRNLYLLVRLGWTPELRKLCEKGLYTPEDFRKTADILFVALNCRGMFEFVLKFGEYKDVVSDPIYRKLPAESLMYGYEMFKKVYEMGFTPECFYDTTDPDRLPELHENVGKYLCRNIAVYFREHIFTDDESFLGYLLRVSWAPSEDAWRYLLRELVGVDPKLYKEFGVDISKRVLSHAVDCGNLELVKFIHGEFGIETEEIKDVLGTIHNKKQCEMVRYLASVGCLKSADIKKHLPTLSRYVDVPEILKLADDFKISTIDILLTNCLIEDETRKTLLERFEREKSSRSEIPV